MIHPSAKIHPTAIVADGAVIGEDVVIGPFCIIEGTVEIKARTVLNSHIVVKGDTVIGEDNQIYQFASIGEVNQDLKYKGEATKTIIGNGNRIREHVTIHRGTIQGGGVTRIGNNNLLMVNVHVAHDCQIKNNCILANNATLAGHVELDDFVIVGGLSAIHQFVIVGAHVMLGGGSMVSQCRHDSKSGNRRCLQVMSHIPSSFFNVLSRTNSCFHYNKHICLRQNKLSVFSKFFPCFLK